MALVLKHLGFHLDGGAEFWDWNSREITDSCGLASLLNHDGTCHWQGSASNVSDPAVHYCEQSTILECLSLAPSVCCALCLGDVGWHKCGSVLGAWESGWDWFLVYFNLLCTIACTFGAPLYLLFNGPTSWKCS